MSDLDGCIETPQDTVRRLEEIELKIANVFSLPIEGIEAKIIKLLSFPSPIEFHWELISNFNATLTSLCDWYYNKHTLTPEEAKIVSDKILKYSNDY